MMHLNPFRIMALSIACGTAILFLDTPCPNAGAAPPTNSRPTITHLDPDNYLIHWSSGGPNNPLDLDVRGSRFHSGTVILLGKTALSTTFVSATELKAQCSVETLRSIPWSKTMSNPNDGHGGAEKWGIIYVRVRNPGRSGLTSRPAKFTVYTEIMGG